MQGDIRVWPSVLPPSSRAFPLLCVSPPPRGNGLLPSEDMWVEQS